MDGEVYPVLYVENNSKVFLRNTTIMENPKLYMKSYVENSKLELDNCVFQDCKLILDHADFKMKNSTLQTGDGNTIHAVRCDVQIESSTIKGSDKEKEYPALWLEKSMASTEDSILSLKKLNHNGGEVSALNIEAEEGCKSYYPKKNSTYETGGSNGNGDSDKPQLSAREQLNQLIGLDSVKREIDKMLRMVEFNQQRIAKGARATGAVLSFCISWQSGNRKDNRCSYCRRGSLSERNYQSEEIYRSIQK